MLTLQKREKSATLFCANLFFRLLSFPYLILQIGKSMFSVFQFSLYPCSIHIPYYHCQTLSPSFIMLIESWDEFAEAASRMFLNDPKNVRFSSE